MAKKKAPNKSGYYKKSFVAGYDGGKQKRVVVYGKSDREAEAKLLKKRIEYEQGRLAVDSSTPFAKWAKQWLETYKKPLVEVNSYKRYRTIIDKHLALIGKMPLKDIRPVHLQIILNDHEGESKSNVKKIYLTMRQIFKQAVINELLAKDPTAGIALPRTTEGERRALTEGERSIFLRAAATHRAGLWVLFMLCCGLRKGETIPLTWGDVDLSKKCVTISKSVTFVNSKAIAKTTKTKAGNRTIPMPDILVDKLKATQKRKDSVLIFTPAQSAGMLTDQHTVRLWSSFMRQADILAGAKLYRNKIIMPALADDITPHMLRHTYATDLYKIGVDLKTAQYLLGHSDIRMTSDIYTHADKERAIGIIDLQNKLYNTSTGDNRGISEG